MLTANPTSLNATLREKENTMRIFDIGLGINNYGGQGNLNGCINDAHDGRIPFLNNIVEATTLIDKDVCPSNVRYAVLSCNGKMQPGDWLLVRNSSHGTNVSNKGHTDFEPSGYDQAVVWWDDSGRDLAVVRDDDMLTALEGLRMDVNLALISDSCHSGGISRGMHARADFFADPFAPKPKFLPMDDHPVALGGFFRKLFQSFVSNVGERTFVGPPRVVLTGCDTFEYSYDAYINRRYNGAFTRTMVNVAAEIPGSFSWRALHAAIKQILPNRDYRQTPQLEGSVDLFDAVAR